MTIDQTYAGIIQECLNGEKVQTRNAECFRTVCVKREFTSTPLVSVRRTAWSHSLKEMEWFLSGSEDIHDLHPDVRHWWEPWADKSNVEYMNGRVWLNYSKQFRHQEGGSPECEPIECDQIQYLIDGIKNHPQSRRNVITTWNTAEMKLAPITNCWGTVIQCFVDLQNRLHLATWQRSVDVICGLPHNLFQMHAFLLWLAHRTGMVPWKLTWIGGDIHVYAEHEEMAKRIVKLAVDDSSPYAVSWRKPKGIYDTPQLIYNPTSEDFKADDFKLDREYLPTIKENVKMVV